MATFVQVIEELKESMFDLQVEQDETTQAIKSLDGRMAEFVALAGRDRLEDLEDRRESKRASQKQEKQNNEDRKNAKKGIGGLSIGDLAQAYVQGRLGMALLSGLGALLLSPIGLGILAGVATATVAGLGLKYILDNPKQLPVGDVSPETEKKILDQISGSDADPIRPDSLPSQMAQAYKPVINIAERYSSEGKMISDKDVEELGIVVRKVRESTAAGLSSEQDLQRAEAFYLRTLQAKRLQEDGGPGTLFAPETRSLREDKAREERLSQEELNTQRLMNLLSPGSYDKLFPPFETKADITSRLIRTQEEKVMKAVENDQGQIDVMATAAQYLTPDPAKAVSVEEFMKPASTMSRDFGQDIIGPIVETAIKSLRTDDNLGLGFFGAPSAGLDINELRDMNLDVEKLSIEIPPNLGGQVLSILGEGLNVGGTTVINNQTTNNVSGGGGGGGATAVNTSSSSVAPSNDYQGSMNPTWVIGGAAGR